ncbi:hypothetical protein E1263_40090 [Kribbella antibiotica]|uniref:Uncharacterized protein n=1 Tax=Kribbella antibiotica TaxID=190195 RepID=A0A4R4YK51_9ACTN|nr:hypothetical protein [Kribbella antibiotica]TDD44750.1 hypothetical protein E1263_40090 [Kribbella antibiotica]
MKLPREKRDEQAVVAPPPEAQQRIEGGGAWGPTQFDLPDRSGSNSQTILIVSLVGALVLLVLAGLWTLVYFRVG